MNTEMSARITACLPRLRRYARTLVKDRDLADDLVQDTCERAWAKAATFRGGDDARPWLFRIMHNLHIDQYKSKRPPIHALDDVPEVPVRATQADHLELRDIGRAFERLPAEFREILLLVAAEGMSYEEVAHTLTIPVGTVMSRLSRARARLRALMEEGMKPMTPTTLQVVR